MGQTSDPETLVIHQKLTPDYNPKTFKQHYEHGGSLQLQHSSSLNLRINITILMCIQGDSGHWRTQGGAAYQQPPPPKTKFKKHRFCRHDDIKVFTWFTLQPKSATEIGWWLVHWNIEKYNKNIKICRFFFSSFNFICNLTRYWLGDFDMV
jgi:hypothetical protein